MQHLTEGMLTIHVVEANLTRDVETLSKMDPFFKIKWSEGDKDKEFKSQALSNAGKTPNW